MDDIIKRVLREYIEMDEVDITPHLNDRVTNRIYNKMRLPIVLYQYIGIGKKTRQSVGEYILSQQEKESIRRNIELLEYVDLPDDIEHRIILHKFKITMNMVNPPYRDMVKERLDERYPDRYTLLLSSSTKNEDGEYRKSYGHTLLGTVGENRLTTTYLARNSQIFKPEGKLWTMDEIEKLAEIQRNENKS